MSAPASVLEHNLRRLFARAWVPVAPREAFRAALERELAARTAERYGSCRGPSGGRPWLRRPAPVAIPAAAAALVIFLGLALLLVRAPQGWWRQAGGEASYQTILAQGDVAVRAGEGVWERFGVPSGASSADLGRPALPLEVVTPSEAGARLALGAGQLDLESGRSRLAVASEERAELTYGGLTAALAPGQSLRVATRSGAVELEGALARLAYEPDSPAVLRVVVDTGRARVEDGSGWHDLAAGERARLRGGRVLPEPTPPAAESGSRVEVPPAVAEGPPSAPAAPPPSLSGSVAALAEGEGGAPVLAPVARYRALLLEEVPLPGASTPEVLEVEDDHGRFAFQVAEPGCYTLFVQADGFAVAQRSDLQLGSGEPLELAIELERGTTVRGAVLDARTGQGVGGAVVLSESDAPVRVLPIDRASLDDLGFVRYAVTDPSGGFELACVAPGAQVLRASDGGLSVAWAETLELAGLAPLEGVEIRLGPGGVVEGEVRGTEGAPRAGVVLLASCADFSKPRPCLSYKQALSDAEGRYRIEGLPAGTAAVLLFGDPAELGNDPAPDLRLALVREGETARVDFAPVQARPRLAGRVVDAAGAPVAGRSLWTLPTGAEETEASLLSATTRADGSFAFEGLEAGPRELYLSLASPPEMVWIAHVDLPRAGLTGLELRTGASALAGRLLAAASLDPVEAGVVVLLTQPEGRFAGRVLLGAGGAFRFELLRPGTYELIAEPSDPALGHARAAGILLPAEGELGDLELLAPPKGP